MRLVEREQESINDFIEIVGADEQPGEEPADVAIRVADTHGLKLVQSNIQHESRIYDPKPGAQNKLSTRV